MKIYLHEMAEERKSLLKKISDIENILNNHLLYLLLFPNEIELKYHWKREILQWLKLGIKKIRIGKTTRNLTKKELIQVLYEIPFENGNESFESNYILNSCKIILYIKEHINSEYRNTPIPVELWKNKLKQFYDSICEMLSKELIDINLFEKELNKFMISH